MEKPGNENPGVEIDAFVQADGVVEYKCASCKWIVRVPDDKNSIEVAGNMRRLCPLKGLSGNIPPHFLAVSTARGKKLLPLQKGVRASRRGKSGNNKVGQGDTPG
jgi:hypothetical protein